MSTENDLAAFQRDLPALLTDPDKQGKYALVHTEKIDSIWATFEEALQAGYDRFGVESFLVMHIIEKEEPKYFSRRAARWPSSPGQ